MKKTNKEIENNVTEVMNAPVNETVALPYTAKEVKTRGLAIRNELKKVDSAFERIAFNLYWFYENKAFETVGYKNIYDMASKEFGIARGTTSNFINVVDRFAERDENGNIIEKISDNYKNFKSSQLIVMLGKSDEELKEIDADMSVREIKKALKGETEETAETDAGTDAAAENEDIEVKEINRQVLVKFRNMDEYNHYLDGMNDLIEKALKKNKEVEIAVVW